jgi:hypothetical protein
MKAMTLRTQPAKPSGRKRKDTGSAFVSRQQHRAVKPSPLRLAAKALAAKPRIDWTCQPLGEDHDSVLAALLGVPEGTVRSARHRRGIPKYRDNKEVPSAEL